MRDRYRLQGLKDDALVAELPKLIARDNEHAADVLAYLGELDARRLYEEMGFHSTWEYCIEALGICQTTAWRKYTAARVCRRFPAMFEAVARGEIQVSVLAELNRCLDENNAEELFAQCRGKSFRHVQQLLAARFPKPDMKDSIRRVPERARPEPVQSENAQTKPERSEPMAPVAEAVPPPPAARPAQRQVEPLSLDRFAVRFTADGEFLALLEEVRGLSGHRDPSGDLLTVLKAGLQAHQRELLKQRFAVGRTPRKRIRPAVEATDESGTNGSRRHIPAEVAREVYERDGGQCTFVSANGRRCSARRQLELDHIEPWAVSKDDRQTNLRLRCRAHNQLGARRYFGKAYMREVFQRVNARGRPERG